MPDDTQRAPESLLPLTPAVLHILLALVDGEKHGYAIMQEVEARTNGAMRLGPGTLYGAIQRMRHDGLVLEASERNGAPPGEERRRYYRLTNFGLRVARAEVQRLEDLVRIAHSKQLTPGFGAMGGVE